MSARLVGYRNSLRREQDKFPHATEKTVSCDSSSSCDVMRIVTIPQRGQANTFGSVRLTTRSVFFLLLPNSISLLTLESEVNKTAYNRCGFSVGKSLK